MQTLADLLKSGIKRQNLAPEAHFPDVHWIHPKLSWEEGTQSLITLFPKDARRERPRPWYEAIRLTHWPRQVPPGNGPFYVPEWCLGVDSPEEATRLTTVLKGAGFRSMTVPIAMLPPTSEYLLAAMRITHGRFAWNVDPILYQVAWYPALGGLAKSPLRPYTTDRWEIRS